MLNYDIVILDALNEAYRCWWPLRASTTRLGRDNSIERGFIGGLVALLQRYFGALLVLAWDGRPVKQVEENPTYKVGRAGKHANRPTDWHQRCNRLREALADVFHTVYDPAGEADQEIARFIKGVTGERVLVVSTDADLLMLLSDHVDVLRPGCTIESYKVADFRQEFGFKPENFVLFRALIGDRSDNIRGLFRFPKAVAQSLVASFRNVDQLYREFHRVPINPVLGQLTARQRQSLQAGEKQVRSNARLIDLLSETVPAHLSRPTGDLAMLLSLLHDLDSTDLADAMTWELNLLSNERPRGLTYSSGR